MEELYQRFLSPFGNLTDEEKNQLREYLLEDAQIQSTRLEQMKTLIPNNQVSRDSVTLMVIYARIYDMINLAQNELNNTYNILILLAEPTPSVPGLDYTDATGSEF